MIVAAGIVLFVVAFGMAALLLPAIHRDAHAVGAVDRPDGGRKDHGHVVAYGGGLAVLAAVAVPVAFGIVTAVLAGGAAWVPADVAVHFPGIRQQAPEVLAILLGAVAMMILGWIDDRRKLPAWPRLLVQVAVAAALAWSGVRVTAFLPAPWMHVLATVVFVVFVTNASNFIDNMNGELAGVAAIQTAGFLAIAVDSGQLFVAASLICLLGGVLAFVPWNYPRARLFLGDAGSLSIGFLLAALTVTCRFQSGGVTPRPFVLPFLVLFVPIADGVLVVITRLLRGVHPFTAGHDHLAHRLISQGMSRRVAVAALWLVAGTAALAAQVIAGTSVVAVAACFAPVALVLGRCLRRPS